MSRTKRSKQWSAAEAARILDRADGSGLSDAAFARKAGVTGQRLSWWREKLGRRRPRGGGRATAPTAPTAFVEVRAKRAPMTGGSPGPRAGAREIEIRLTNGRSVLVPESVDVERLGHLLAAAEGQPC